MKKLFLPLLLLLGVAATAQVKIGNNPTMIGTSSVLELENPNKSLLLTRVAKVSDVAIPAEGMILYDISRRCVRSYENGTWSFCLSGVPSTTNYISGGICTAKAISRTPCANVAGAVLNDDTGTSGIEYNWAPATSTTLGVGFGADTSFRALIEINEQCWATTNVHIVPNAGGATGSYDYPIAGQGFRYQWSALMNGNNAERAQGVCPVSWHVPSECEWLFLAISVGASWNPSLSTGDGGTSLLTGGSSGFRLIKNGSDGGFGVGLTAYIWASTVRPQRYRGNNGPNIFIDDSDYNSIEMRDDDDYYASKNLARCIKD